VTAEGGGKAVIAALSANAGIAVAKFVGFLFTGSSSMLAEAVHSLADTSNQALLLLGRRTSKRKATAEHPFGFGRERYFYGFVVALLLFSVGAIFAIYEGVEKIITPHPLEAPLVAIIILFAAAIMEGLSFRTAMKESRLTKGKVSWFAFIRQAKSPDLPVVLLEDTGALIGLIFALLGVFATVLIVETKSLLIGEGASPELLATIVGELECGKVDRVIHIRTQYLSPDEMLVAAKIALADDVPLEDVAQAIDDAELRVRTKVPTAKLIYLEPDLYREPAQTSPAADEGPVASQP
jgi:divalent metal cation (Fe/Co/Zn/Cd) transporter